MRRSPLHIARVSEDDEVEVLRTNPIAYGFLEVASELWRLAGDAARAKQIDDVVVSAYELEPPRLDEARIETLKSLLENLDAAVIGPLTDDQRLLSPAKVEELRGNVKTLEVAGEYGSDPQFAVQSALGLVGNLRAILDEAQTEHASILFD